MLAMLLLQQIRCCCFGVRLPGHRQPTRLSIVPAHDPILPLFRVAHPSPLVCTHTLLPKNLMSMRKALRHLLAIVESPLDDAQHHCYSRSLMCVTGVSQRPPALHSSSGLLRGRKVTAPVKRYYMLFFSDRTAQHEGRSTGPSPARSPKRPRMNDHNSARSHAHHRPPPIETLLAAALPCHRRPAPGHVAAPSSRPGRTEPLIRRTSMRGADLVGVLCRSGSHGAAT